MGAPIITGAIALLWNSSPYIFHLHSGHRYAWFLIFSEETGKIVEIREYLDTALVQEVNQTNAP
jgi:hypothetical protein